MKREGKEDKTKKEYNTPHLKVYGDIRVITGTVGKRGSPDGGGPGAKKTSI